jgi:hypothetical protein
MFDDSRRLARVDAQMPGDICELMEREIEFARLGAITRGGGWWVPRILTAARSPDDSPPHRDKRLAFALGGVTHFACDLLMKPLLRGNAPLSTYPGGGKREVSAYYDVHVFREVYLAGNEQPFNRFLLAGNATEPGKALEAFVCALFQRALLSSHTLSPEKSNFDGWFNNLVERVQPLYIDINLYVSVFQAPDSELMQRYRVETDFYRRDDPIIRLARRVQAGASISQAELDAALSDEANRSGYGKGLRLSIVSLRQAAAFLAGRSQSLPDVTQ